jgi:hypothetical protein
MTEIMPANRTWDKDTEALAHHLVDNALPQERAALALLFRSPMFESDEFRSKYVRPRASTNSEAFDWDHLCADLEFNYWPMSAAVSAQLLIACHLAGGLGAELSRLDTDGVRHALDAIYIAVRAVTGMNSRDQAQQPSSMNSFDSAPTTPYRSVRKLPTAVIETVTGRVEITCEPVGEHLAIVPVLIEPFCDTYGFLAGLLNVTHVASGRCLTNGGVCVTCASKAAILADQCGIDWSEVPLDEAWWTPERKALIAPALAVLSTCDAYPCEDDDDDAIVHAEAASPLSDRPDGAA